MPPKRKAPLATGDANSLVVPAAKKAARGKGVAQAGTSAAAAVKKYNYSDPISVDNQEPAEITFVMFSAPENEDDDSDTDEVDKEEEEVIPGSLQGILDRLEKEKEKAVHEALNPPHELVNGCRTIEGGEARRRIAEASNPYEEKMDEARHKFVTAGMMTAEEAKAIVPNIRDDSKKKKDKNAEKADFVPPRVVTDKGFPVTKAGMERFLEINQEVDKRDQDTQGMYIYNDFSGYGVIEVLENTLAEFNKIIFKKDVSPLKKWAVVEGLTIYLAIGDHMTLMMNDNSQGIREVFDMMGVMYITALEMLHESGLIGPISPLPDNLGVVTLFFLDFMINTASNFDIGWVHEIVRAADTYGVVLSPSKHIKGVDQGTLSDLKEMCKKKKGKRFNWKTEYPKFKRYHSGGHQYDITKMSKKGKAQYTFGTKEYDEQWEI
ncbi:hypothetical protein OIDMADRAFT_148790 [Oidiodendron maius Zn]|uniref:Uncharacterized protein n=1 Tax=Oidiodendron maius (strain Zn) TaxID=913774 RepID=A0A0C3D1G0_OIDMZ|nr:hypothetical protein OIDMADRAFT_148790 [Oidiodendron maius Zn]